MRKIFLPALAFVIAACAPTTRPISVPPDLERTLLERLEHSGGQFSSLEGIAKVRVVNPEKTVSATQVLLAEKPDKLRSEILSPFGTPMLLMATDGHELTVYVPSEARFYRGEASDANIRRLLRIPMRLDDLVDILLYDLPIFDYRQVRADVEDNRRFVLTLDGEGGSRQVIRFDRELQLAGARYIVEGDVLLEVDYQFNASPSGYPSRVSVQMPQQQSSVSVAFSEVENNTEIPPDRFRLTPPAGVDVTPIPDNR
ncbi:MAG: DUF4292 domain-containing protein [Desulfuromonadales bacterium]|nr:DUF4292 domain-containing protein [Desulfuromonadales bacterium]NIR33576.1 DUF4292 domain-containing protein [Desulfuromonadales bacterium]NIS42275.1 DUF4292 domain-containing protein [Desulfuromonadales bacterium]